MGIPVSRVTRLHRSAFWLHVRNALALIAALILLGQVSTRVAADSPCPETYAWYAGSDTDSLFATPEEACIAFHPKADFGRGTIFKRAELLENQMNAACIVTGPLGGYEWPEYYAAIKCVEFEPEDTSCPTDTPTFPGTGVKLLREDDVAGAGVHPLHFTRHYRSRWPNGIPSAALPMGAGWTHTYDRSIHLVRGEPTPMLRALRGDGSWRTFVRDESSSTATSVTWRDISPRDTQDRLTQKLTSNGQTSSWIYRPHSDDSVETYDASGRLMSIQARNGRVTTLVYSSASTPSAQAPKAGLLLAVRNAFGRELNVSYDSAGRVSKLTMPGGEVIGYAHDALGNLIAVTMPGTDTTPPATKRYHYEDPQPINAHALTGLTDALGVRITTYTYDALGQVASTEKAQGMEKLSFQFNNAAGSGAASSTIFYTPSPGAASTSTQYSFSSLAGVLRPTSVTTPCPLCGASAAATSYDTNQRKSKVIAHDGRVTFYTYNAKGRVTREASYPASYQSATTAPPLSAAEHVTHTQWHATWNLPLKVAEAYLITSYSYDSKGNLLEMVETPTTDAIGAKGFNATPSGTTSTTRWTYDAKNLPTTIVELEGSTETGRWEMVYNATGDLTGITHVTTGTVATLVPVGNGVSQFTDIRASTGNSVAGVKRFRPTLDLFVSRANANPLLLVLPAFESAAVGEFLAMCSVRMAPGLGLVVASTAKDASCNRPIDGVFPSDNGSKDECGKWMCEGFSYYELIGANKTVVRGGYFVAHGGTEPTAALNWKKKVQDAAPSGYTARHIKPKCKKIR